MRGCLCGHFIFSGMTLYYLKVVSRWRLISKLLKLYAKKASQLQRTARITDTGNPAHPPHPEMSTLSSHLVAVSGGAVNGGSFRECWAQCLCAFSIHRVWKAIQNQLGFLEKKCKIAFVHSNHQCCHQPMLFSFWQIRWVQHAIKAKGAVNYGLCFNASSNSCLLFSSSFIKVDFRSLERWVTERYPWGKRADRRQQC